MNHTLIGATKSDFEGEYIGKFSIELFLVSSS